MRTNHDTPDFCEQKHIFGNLRSLQFVTQQIPRQHWQLFWYTFCWFHKLHLDVNQSPRLARTHKDTKRWPRHNARVVIGCLVCVVRSSVISPGLYRTGCWSTTATAWWCSYSRCCIKHSELNVLVQDLLRLLGEILKIEVFSITLGYAMPQAGHMVQSMLLFHLKKIAKLVSTNFISISEHLGSMIPSRHS